MAHTTDEVYAKLEDVEKRLIRVEKMQATNQISSIKQEVKRAITEITDEIKRANRGVG